MPRLKDSIRRNVFYDAERSGIEYANCVDAGFSYIETAVAHVRPLGMTPRRVRPPAVLKARPHKGGELGVGQQMASVSTHLDDSVVVSKETKTSSSVAAIPVGAAPPTVSPGVSLIFVPKSQLCGDDGVPSIVHIAGPQGTSADRVFIAEAGNLFSFATTPSRAAIDG